MSLDLVVVGNLVVDDLVFPDGRTRFAQAGGAVAFSALAARLWGLEVGIVTYHGEEYPVPALEILATRGVDLSGAHPMPGSGLRSWLLYENQLVRRVIHRLVGPSHEEATPIYDEIPDSFRAAKWMHLAPMPFEHQLALIDRARSCPTFDGVLSLDPFAILDRLEPTKRRELLARIDALFVSRDELGSLTEEDLALVAGKELRYLVLKRGAEGGRLRCDEDCSDWEARTLGVVDPTGAGDAFAGGFIAGLVRGDTNRGALERGVVSASFAIEDWGFEGLASVLPSAAEKRLSSWYGRSGG